MYILVVIIKVYKEQVQEFITLGRLLTADSSTDKETTRRIEMSTTHTEIHSDPILIMEK